MNKKQLKQLAQDTSPAIEKAGYELVDIDHLFEEGRQVLRFYIYKEGGVNLDDCEAVNNVLDPLLDELTPISGRYYLEVSSPDLTRPLKTDRDLERNLGENLVLSFYQKHDGKKEWVGRLEDFDDDQLYLDVEGEKKSIPRKDLSKIVLAIEF